MGSSEETEVARLRAALNALTERVEALEALTPARHNALQLHARRVLNGHDADAA